MDIECRFYEGKPLLGGCLTPTLRYYCLRDSFRRYVGSSMQELGSRKQEVGCRRQDVGCRKQDVGCRTEDAGYRT